MAAALLMMNMQGAVMAADKDLTIFRYSDKVPFALITDPASSFPWEKIWNKFRVCTLSTENYAEEFLNYLENSIPSHESKVSFEKFLLVYYCAGQIFPEAHCFQLKTEGKGPIIKPEETDSIISPSNATYIQWIGNYDNIGTLFKSEIADKKEELMNLIDPMVDRFKSDMVPPEIKLILSISSNEIKERLKKKFASLIKEYDDKRRDGIAKTINTSHIEDMVRMVENLIDAEGQQHHLQYPDEQLESTKEIATMTLAEGFKWIKHCLYGAI